MGCPSLSFGVDLRTFYKSRHYSKHGNSTNTMNLNMINFHKNGNSVLSLMFLLRDQKPEA